MRRHFLAIQGTSREDLLGLISNAESFVEVSTRDIKKVPTLRGKTIINLFLEPSTRTRASFEIAGKRLSADTINVSEGGSSVVKGETLLDTARTLESMAPDILVVRHRASGAAQFLAEYLKDTSVVNAGDGMHEHPTQALLDLLTLRQYFSSLEKDISGLKIAIVGDIFHSRVARSNIWAHKILGNEIRLVAPPTLIPQAALAANCFGSDLKIHHSLSEGIKGADVVMVLRMQSERQGGFFLPSTQEYSREYCVSERMLSRFAPESVVLHPGPVNRGLEVSGEVIDGPRSLVNLQVTNGVAVRMSVLMNLSTGIREQGEEQ